MLSADEASREGIPFCEIWSYLNAADFNQSQEQADEVLRSWWQESLGTLMHKGVLLADAICGDMREAFTAGILAHTILNRIIDDKKPKRLVVFSDTKRAFLSDSSDIPPPPDIFNAVALWVARVRNLPTTRLSVGKAYGVRGTRPLLAPGNGNPQPPAFFVTRHEVGERKVILSFLQVLDRLNCSSLDNARKLLEALDRGGKWEHLSIVQNMDDVQSLPGNVINWQDCTGWVPISPTLIRQLRDAWSNFKRQQVRKTSSSFAYLVANPHLDFQFRVFWQRLREAVQTVDVATMIFQGLRPRLCLIGTDQWGIAVCWKRVAKLLGAKTLSLQHGSITNDYDQFELQNHEVDYVAVEGEYSRKRLIELGRAAETIEVVGHRGSLHLPSPPEPLSPKTVLLMTTLAGESLLWNQCNLAKLRGDWGELVSIVGRHPETRFIIRPHPRFDQWDFYRRLCTDHTPNLELSTQATLPSASLAVMFNYPSSVALDTMLAAIPTVYVRSSVYQTKRFRSPLDGSLSVKSCEELENVINALLNDETRRAEWLRVQNQFLGEYLCDRHVEVRAQRIVDFVDRIVSGLDSTKQREPAEPERSIVQFIWRLPPNLGAKGDVSPWDTGIFERVKKMQLDGYRVTQLRRAWLAWRSFREARYAFREQSYGISAANAFRGILESPSVFFSHLLAVLRRKLSAPRRLL
jgi:hypothetical protein